MGTVGSNLSAPGLAGEMFSHINRPYVVHVVSMDKSGVDKINARKQT